jgi:hypothetical protein
MPTKYNTYHDKISLAQPFFLRILAKDRTTGPVAGLTCFSRLVAPLLFLNRASLRWRRQTASFHLSPREAAQV